MAGPGLGDRITADEMDMCPVGTVMTSGGRNYTKDHDGMWVREGHPSYRYGVGDFGGVSNLVSMPNGQTSLNITPPSLKKYQWKFREHALRAAVDNGVSYSASRHTIERMGVKAEDFPIGAGVIVKNPETMTGLPEGTIVFTGNPETPMTGYGVWQRQRGTWVRLLGGNDSYPERQRAIVVHSINGDRTVPEWWGTPGTEEDVAEINKFKAVAWRHGWTLKREQSWCGTYESIMAQFGLTAAVTQVSAGGLLVGQHVSPDQAKSLPVGTLLSWVSTNGTAERALYVRTTGADNVAGTVRVGGENERSARNYRSSMTIVAIPSSDFRNRPAMLPSSEWWRFIPVGTIFCPIDDPSEYRIFPEGRAGTRQDSITERGRWSLNDFDRNRMLIITHLEGITL